MSLFSFIMVTPCVQPGSGGGELRQDTIGFKKMSKLTANGKALHEFINVMHIAKAKLAVVQRKNADPASPVARVPVVKLSTARKLVRAS